MAEVQVERRLVAILAADVVGYSRLMESNEERTMSALKQHRREFFEPTMAKHGGSIFSVVGDGFMAEFGSVLNAARCAVEIQRDMVERNVGVPEDRHIKFRIGMNLGDIIVDGDGFCGDSVSMAARLEGLAGPGGIACSAVVRNQISNKLELDFLDQGEKTVIASGTKYRAGHDCFSYCADTDLKLQKVCQLSPEWMTINWALALCDFQSIFSARTMTS